MQNGWGRRHTMSSVDVTTFVIYSLILCAVAQWNLNTTEAQKIEGGVECARRTKSSFDGTGLPSRFGGNCPPLPPGFRRPWNSQRRAEKAAEKNL